MSFDDDDIEKYLPVPGLDADDYPDELTVIWDALGAALSVINAAPSTKATFDAQRRIWAAQRAVERLRNDENERERKKD